jgi:hypothetical protein
LLSAAPDDTLSTTIKKVSIEKPALPENQNFAQKLVADTRGANSTIWLQFGSQLLHSVRIRQGITRTCGFVLLSSSHLELDLLDPLYDPHLDGLEGSNQHQLQSAKRDGFDGDGDREGILEKRIRVPDS